MNWILTGLPLALLSCVYVWLTTKDIGSHAALISLAVLYLGTSFCALSSSRSVRKVAVLAWCPLLLAIPIGTIFGILAIRLLLDDAEARHEIRENVKAMAPAEIEQLLRTMAETVLEIPNSKFDASIESDLGVPPVELINFLDKLKTEYGLPVSSDDRKNIDSVEDIVRMVTSRATETV